MTRVWVVLGYHYHDPQERVVSIHATETGAREMAKKAKEVSREWAAFRKQPVPETGLFDDYDVEERRLET